MRRLPIRARVTLAFAAAMTVLLIALGLFIYSRFESNLNDTIDEGLRSRSSEITALLHARPAGRVEGSSDLLVHREESFAQVLTGSGAIFATTPETGERALLDRAQLQSARSGEHFSEVGPLPHVTGPSRLLAKPVRADGRDLIVVVGSSLDDRNDALRSLRNLLLLGGAAALLLASLAGYLAIGAALRPVEAMRRRAAEISSTELDQRLPVSESGDELSRLGETLNQMLARLEAALERERTFVDDASHELRTPLALQRAELEVALRYGKDEDELRAAIGSAIEEVDRLSGLAEDLLVLARSEKGNLPLEREPVSVAELLAEVGRRFESSAAEAGRRLEIEAPEGDRIEADRRRLEQALTNLVDNALRHGGGEVRLFSRRVDGRLELHVSDQGDGFAPEFTEHAFERFSRADPARGRGGSGLGLAIVDAIARAHGGRAVAGNAASGGADVWIELPSGG